jgi:hypothetical protein
MFKKTHQRNMMGTFGRLAITHKERLLRFGAELIFSSGCFKRSR